MFRIWLQLDSHGHVITDTKQIAYEYIKGWFVIDFISVMPIQYITILFNSDNTGDGDDNPGRNQRLTKILRLVRLAKNVARLGRIQKLQELWTRSNLHEHFSNNLCIVMLATRLVMSQ